MYGQNINLISVGVRVFENHCLHVATVYSNLNSPSLEKVTNVN